MNFSKLMAVLSAFTQRRTDTDATPRSAGTGLDSSPACGLREGGLARLMDQADREARLLSLTVRPF
jgi:hypothetical protein